MPEKHSHSRTKSALGGGEKSKAKSKSQPKSKKDSSPKVPEATKKYIDQAVKKAIQRMHISKTANGRFLVDHEFKTEPGQPPADAEQHALGPEDLSAHVGEYLGLDQPVVSEPALPPDISAAPQLPAAGGPSGPGPMISPEAGPSPLPVRPLGV